MPESANACQFKPLQVSLMFFKPLKTGSVRGIFPSSLGIFPDDRDARVCEVLSNLNFYEVWSHFEFFSQFCTFYTPQKGRCMRHLS
jgi:hypothetical protein